MHTGFGERLKMARSMAGFSQQTLADQVGLSKMAISKYENNQMVPGSQALIALAKVLGRRIDFFLRGPVEVDLQPVYRSKAALRNVPKREAVVIAQLQEWIERYLAAESLFPPTEIPHFAFPDGFPTRIDSLEAVEAAGLALRHAWDLGDNPIENMTELLEEQGIKVGLVDGSDDFDACQFQLANGDPVIAVKQDLPGDRQRFNLAHELGHLMLDAGPDVDEEKMANRFAGSFLAPAPAVRYELGGKRGRLDMMELHLLKHRYGLSMQGWAYRAKDLGIMDERAMRTFWKSLNSNGWKKEEPGDALPAETPQRLTRLVLRALAEDVISRSRAEELLGMPWPRFAEEQKIAHGNIPLAVRA